MCQPVAGLEKERTETEMSRSGKSGAMRVYLPLGLALAVFAVYLNALRNPFLLEDQAVLAGAAQVHDPQGWRDLWTSPYLADAQGGPRQYRPVAVLSYWTQTHAPGDWSGAPALRLVNVGILALTGCALALWLRGYLSPTTAWLTAAVFVVHPLNAEAVNVITGRAQLLALLGVLGFLALQRRAILAGRWSTVLVLGALLTALVAVGSDTTGLLVLPLAVAQALLGRCTDPVVQPWHQVQRGNAPPGPCPSCVRWLGPVLLLGPMLLYVAGRSVAIGWTPVFSPGAEDLTGNPLLSAAWTERLPAALALGWFYARQLVWPELCFNTIPAHLPGWDDAPTWAGLALVGLLLVGVWWTARRRNWLLLPGLLALGQYVLVAHVLLPGPLYAANRLALPMSAALLAALAAGLEWLTAGSPRRRAALMIPVALIALVLALDVVYVNRHCASPLVMRAADAERQVDNPVAQFQYARALRQNGEFEKAANRLESVVDRRPRSVEARWELAEVLQMLGRPGEALAQYDRIVALAPGDERAKAQRDELKRRLERTVLPGL